MRCLPIAKPFLIVAIALTTLVVAASASAAAWQGPLTISEATVNATTTPAIALGRSGDAVAAWWDDTSGGRIAFARKRAGGTWSAPLTVVAPVTSTPLFPTVDASGNISVAYASGGITTIATWAAGATAPTLTPLAGLPAGYTIGGFAVNGAGDAVLAGFGGGGTSELTVAYRQGPTGAFTLRNYPYLAMGFAVTSARAAINASGMATVIFKASTLRSITRTAAVDWLAIPEEVTPITTVQDTDQAVGIDAAGTTYAAFTYTIAGPATVLRTALRPPGGGWQQSSELSPVTATSSASSVSLQVSPSGTTGLVWLQAVGAVVSVKARYGSTTTPNVWGAIEDVNDDGASAPTAAIADDGSVVAVWERMTAGNNTGQARVRTPGAAGTWGDIRTLSDPHPNGTTPALSGDGLGDFATVSSPGVSVHPVMLSSYDAAPPVIAAPTVTGNLLAGTQLTLAATATDAWSTAGTPAWTFGDGAAATGASVTHTYAIAGTYTAHVSVTDSAGNSAGKDVTIVVGTGQATLSSAKFTARWKQSRVTGTLVVKGAAPAAGAYVLDVLKGKTRKFHFSVKLTTAAFSRTIRLPATFLPGTYRVALIPAANFAKRAEISAKLAAPPEGVVDVTKLSATRAGKAVRTIRVSRSLFASFHFAAIPKGALKLTWYRTSKGKRTILRSVTRKPVARITDSLALRGRRGTIAAVLTRSGKIIVQGSVKAT